jgi:hypothetical protein
MSMTVVPEAAYPSGSTLVLAREVSRCKTQKCIAVSQQYVQYTGSNKFIFSCDWYVCCLSIFRNVQDGKFLLLTAMKGGDCTRSIYSIWTYWKSELCTQNEEVHINVCQKMSDSWVSMKYGIQQ